MGSGYYTPIITRITTGTGKPAAMGDRVYADQLPDDPELPAVRIALLADRPHQRLDGGDNTTPMVQVDVYGRRGDEQDVWTIDSWVRQRLDRVDLVVTGFSVVHSMCIDRGRPFREDGYYRVTSQYRLHGSAA